MKKIFFLNSLGVQIIKKKKSFLFQKMVLHPAALIPTF